MNNEEIQSDDGGGVDDTDTAGIYVLGNEETFVKVNTLLHEIEIQTGGDLPVRARFNGFTGTAWVEANRITLDSPNPVIIPNGTSNQ